MSGNKTYVVGVDFGTLSVPSFLLESDIVYQDNITELLIDSEYWTQEEVDSGVAE
ncbi:hypothetical protein [uncultured Serinicoccus sp.]|uniref:hypothetical protein n=1 Tax=uncultured Serinicoccus sp. TaxID=735514 RepID=UPI00262A8016|nr:hypothetical protein [uncultured Serinicoccus sp.]